MSEEAVALPAVNVVTVTRDRDVELLRCLQSVADQDYQGEIEHVVVLDGPSRYRRVAASLVSGIPGRTRLPVGVSADEKEFDAVYTVARIGYLRNQGLRHCRGAYIAYLDDDNTFERHHVSSLVELLSVNPEVGIAYSWRRLWHPDGSPFVDEAYPWTPQARLATSRAALSAHIYEELVRVGVRTPASNIQKDTLNGPRDEQLFTVDTSELLVRREIHHRFQWATRFAWREMVGDYSDDYEFVRRCYRSGVKFACSCRPTLNYFVGGVSNDMKHPSDHEAK